MEMPSREEFLRNCEDIYDEIKNNEEVKRKINAGGFEAFKSYLMNALSEIWASIKDYARRAWDWVKDLFGF